MKPETAAIHKNVQTARKIFELRARRSFAITKARYKVKSQCRWMLWRTETTEGRAHEVAKRRALKRLWEGEDLYEVLYPAMDYSTVRALRIRKNGGMFFGGLALLLHEMQDGKCALCSKPMGKAFRIDHKAQIVHCMKCISP